MILLGIGQLVETTHRFLYVPSACFLGRVRSILDNILFDAEKRDESRVLFHCSGLFGDLMLGTLYSALCYIGKFHSFLDGCLSLFGGEVGIIGVMFALRGCVEAVMLMSADVRRHVFAIVLVLGSNRK